MRSCAQIIAHMYTRNMTTSLFYAHHQAQLIIGGRTRWSYIAEEALVICLDHLRPTPGIDTSQQTCHPNNSTYCRALYRGEPPVGQPIH